LKTADLKKQYLNKKMITILFADNTLLDLSREGITIEKNKKGEAIFTVDTTVVSIEDILKDILHNRNIEDVTIEDPPLEEIIGRIYEKETY